MSFEEQKNDIETQTIKFDEERNILVFLIFQRF